nr:MerR family transcriptional regulator [uncultured Caldimonas sp.]
MLKIGELARHAGLTVRTLHHYDDIGLLRPSGRSEAGYRLYTHHEIERLHGIQALRHLGLTLDEIRRLLDDGGRETLPVIIEQQVRALDRQIEQATQLRRLLGLMQAKFSAGEEPATGDWLATLRSMTTCDRYFSAEELKLIFGNWPRIAADFSALMLDVREAMDGGIPPDSVEVQPLAHRWMLLMSQWLEGDLDLMRRWGEMYKREPATRNDSGPTLAMVAYIEGAIERRLQALCRHFTLEELRQLRPVPPREWAVLAAAARDAMRQGHPPGSIEGQAIGRQRLALLHRAVGHDASLAARLLAAHRTDPFVAAGSPLPPDVRGYLDEATHAVLDPHAA